MFFVFLAIISSKIYVCVKKSNLISFFFCFSFLEELIWEEDRISVRLFWKLKEIPSVENVRVIRLFFLGVLF